MVNRHAILLNPALSVRGERYEVVERKTPEITVKGARTLLASIKDFDLVSLRDRAVVAILIYTAARAGAVATLRRTGLYNSGEQWMLHFDEKGGKSREIPARHDLEQIVFEYIAAAGIVDTPADPPLFRTAIRKSGKNSPAPFVLRADQCTSGALRKPKYKTHSRHHHLRGR
jgi:integrase/recombinase XerD